MFKRKKHNWTIPEGQEPTAFDKKILSYQNQGFLVPTRKLIKTPEQIEGIKQSGVINTGVLDLIEQEIHAGMTTEEIDKLKKYMETDEYAEEVAREKLGLVKDNETVFKKQQ